MYFEARHIVANNLAELHFNDFFHKITAVCEITKHEEYFSILPYISF